jgi:hypothetical protein
MQHKLKLALYKLIPVSLLAMLRFIVEKMTGNPNFLNPIVPLDAMNQLADDLEAAITMAKQGSPEARSLRDDLFEQGKVLLAAQADYVQAECRGDRTKLLSSGFDLAKTPEPRGIPAVPENVLVRMTGKTGQVELRFNGSKIAVGYHMFMTDKDPLVNADWEPVGYTTRSRHLFEGLVSYKPYWFAVSAVGTAGESAKSDAAAGRAA